MTDESPVQFFPRNSDILYRRLGKPRRHSLAPEQMPEL